ncbi:Zn-ribbon domain-containing OB-fold protein [Novosphingobium sp. BL-52-GroH]|uniref:Zn-ribbon domain-containing OB-fold protein n=1 Tax=Novosphingobium sp. BL-52-GroH TaxID=3349877 RepID=UPI00384ADE45
MAYSFEQHKIIGAIEADDEFWRGLEDGKFQLPRCSGCRAWNWPAHHRCGQCGSWEFEWTALEPRGTVFTYTRTQYRFDRVLERAEDVPYVTVVAELPEADGARVMGVLCGDEAGLAIGARVRGVIRPPSAKTKHYPAIEWELER